MGWDNGSRTIRGITYYNGKLFTPAQGVALKGSTDGSGASSSTSGQYYYYGVFNSAYSYYPYNITRNAGQGGYFCTEDAFPFGTWTLDYNANGGTGAPGRQIKTWGYLFNISGQIPTKTGYRFIGWASAPNGNIVYQPNQLYGDDNNNVIYASWAKLTYTMTFLASANGGATDSTKTIEYDTAIGLLPLASRSGYELLGWYTAPTGGTKITSESRFTSDVTVYAQFKAKSSAHVYTGGSWRAGSPHIYTGGAWHKGYKYTYTGGAWRKGISV